ncbi:MAG: glucokinase [Myxococcota bacterium]
MMLAGDIGGTKTVLAIFQRDAAAGGLVATREARYPSGSYASLDDIVRAFLADGPERPTAACFGVAGPVADGKAKITNLPWVIDASAMAAAFGFAEVRLLNDLQAAAYGALQLGPDQLAVLQPGTPGAAPGNVAVVAPGTGLGEAILFWDGTRYHALPSEGGHTDFAPQTDREVRLLIYLRQRLGGHVSWERILSGAGLGHLYDFLRDVERMDEPPALAARLAAGDRNAAISAAGLAKAFPICAEALSMFARLLGAEAGNLALKCFATGGIVIAGGIPAKILPALQDDGAFRAGLTDKGRFSGWVGSLAVRVALDPRAPLIGAAHHLGDSLEL